MSMSDKVKGLLALCGKKQTQLAESFGMSRQTMGNKIGMSRQTMGNKMARNSWSGNDLAKAAEFCGCKLAFLLPDGQQIILNAEDKNI